MTPHTQRRRDHGGLVRGSGPAPVDPGVHALDPGVPFVEGQAAMRRPQLNTCTTHLNNRCPECRANNMDHWPWCSQFGRGTGKVLDHASWPPRPRSCGPRCKRFETDRVDSRDRTRGSLGVCKPASASNWTRSASAGFSKRPSWRPHRNYGDAMLSDAERRELRRIETRLAEETPVLDRLLSYSLNTEYPRLSMYSLLWAGLILIGTGLLIRQNECIIAGLWAVVGWPIQVHVWYGHRQRARLGPRGVAPMASDTGFDRPS